MISRVTPSSTVDQYRTEGTPAKAAIEIYTDNGDVIAFKQNQENYQEDLATRLTALRTFEQKAISFLSSFSVIDIQTQAIDAIRCQLSEPLALEFPNSQPDLIEISKNTFLTQFNLLSDTEKLAARDAVAGEMVTHFAEAKTQGKHTFYFRLQLQKKTDYEGRLNFAQIFNTPRLLFTIEENGFGILRSNKVICLKIYPGPGRNVLPSDVIIVD